MRKWKAGLLAAVVMTAFLADAWIAFSFLAGFAYPDCYHPEAIIYIVILGLNPLSLAIAGWVAGRHRRTVFLFLGLAVWAVLWQGMAMWALIVHGYGSFVYYALCAMKWSTLASAAVAGACFWIAFFLGRARRGPEAGGMVAPK